jgi:hypothetical protein
VLLLQRATPLKPRREAIPATIEGGAISGWAPLNAFCRADEPLSLPSSQRPCPGSRHHGLPEPKTSLWLSNHSSLALQFFPSTPDWHPKWMGTPSFCLSKIQRESQALSLGTALAQPWRKRDVAWQSYYIQTCLSAPSYKGKIALVYGLC